MRARRQSLVVALAVGAGVFALACVAAPPDGSIGLLVGELLLAGLVAGAVGVAVDRWNQARIVDLRHHDLFEGLRGASSTAPAAGQPVDPATEVDLTVPAAAPAPSGQHQLFGNCSCADCVAGRPAPVDLRADAVHRDAGRSVVDLRTGSTRPRRGRLGQR